MGKHRHSKVTKAAVAGTAIAAAVGMGFTPTIANAVSSNTYFIGFPDWLPIGDGNTLDSNPNTVYQAILDAKDKDPLVGWGTGGVDLNPVWVQWYNPNLGGLSLGDINLGDLSPAELAELVSHIDLGEATNPNNDQYYTPRQWGQTGTKDVLVDNPAYQEAFEAALAQVMQEDRDAILAADKIDITLSYTVPQPSWWTEKKKILFVEYSLEGIFGSWASQKIGGQSLGQPISTTVTIDNPFKGDPAKLDQFLETGEYEGSYPVVVDPAQALGLNRPSFIPASTWNSWFKPINIGDVDYSFDRTKFGLPGASWDERAEDIVDPTIPKQVPQTQPVFGWIPGGWTTNTFGQWVSPTNDITGLQDLDLGALLNGNFDLGAPSGLTTRDLAYFLSGDLGFLAPVLNWTTYLQNINLIAYGDGAIATGEAYRRYLEAIKNGEIKAGEPQTDGRYLVITTDEDGNPVVKAVNHTTGDGGIDEIITSYPLPDDLEFPNMPVDPVTGQPLYPSYTEVPGGVIDVTLMTMALLRNPGRPNGGLYARFAPIYQELTGINPVSPERTDVLYGLPPDTITKLVNGDVSGVDLDDLGDLLVVLNDADGKPMVITIKADATWEYDLLSDAPVNANPVAWANSVMSSMLVLTYGNELLGMATGETGSGVGMVAYTVPTGEYDAGSFYATLTTDSLPLLAPIRLVAGLLGTATGEDVNTPVADALEPVLKLLVNTSYTDVVRNADGTWTRTLDQMHVPTLFGTQTLTREQSVLLAGDIIAELGKGVGAEYTDVVQRVTARVVKFLEDNDIQVPTEVKEAAAKLATEPGKAIQRVSRQIGDDVSKVLGGIEAKLPEAPAAPTQQQLAAGQSEVGKVARAVKDDVETAGEAAANAGEKVEADVAKRVTKTQKSLTHAQERAAKVADKLKQGDLKGAAKQVGENIKNRTDRLKKDINNGVDKLKGKKDKTNSEA
ncbi:PE-PPE domain-containing protein [Mycolicibacterium conceptionense]|uniref:PE-PPE domain-containing protein n=1 Tax=Mycolicibacterium conceptionense TaxID=451644 RepID=A0A1A1WA66_9MYCO|nr:MULTISPECIES: PE-PPE domain-containing protein [Mycolicibacterium]MCW1822083.1 PE-PPE domain-containing protein [Mycolicibacterium senegalense]OBB06348.1 PE-PPE domain-containing protein [Mycolicibacterium conceptionense]OBF03729.1 PE-PPE domain-containing protein [Mycolicibacterium conceptionense]OBF14332.1 PE-PPE domain-containing protein [Mycolicibacterium conceptionense]OBF31776.1 PE-PPE domain-containing protein [Mycolicibacterium conceptionense]